MGYRSFKDSAGVEWDAWDVMPQLGERRVAERRLSRRPIEFNDRRRAERRTANSGRAQMPRHLAGGWLCFEGASGKRRLSPIPGDWTRCDESRLEEYCQAASPVRRAVEVGRDRASAT